MVVEGCRIAGEDQDSARQRLHRRAYPVRRRRENQKRSRPESDASYSPGKSDCRKLRAATKRSCSFHQTSISPHNSKSGAVTGYSMIRTTAVIMRRLTRNAIPTPAAFEGANSTLRLAASCGNCGVNRNPCESFFQAAQIEGCSQMPTPSPHEVSQPLLAWSEGD